MPTHRATSGQVKRLNPKGARLNSGEEYAITPGRIMSSVEGFTSAGGDPVTGAPPFFETYGLHKDPTECAAPMHRSTGAENTTIPEKFMQKTREKP